MGTPLGVRLISSISMACVCVASAPAATCRATGPAPPGASRSSHTRLPATSRGSGVGVVGSRLLREDDGVRERARTGATRRRCATVSSALGRWSSVEGVPYEVHAVTGDGRCLFRSVAAALALAGEGGGRKSAADESLEADRLRDAAVDELVKRRAEVEWFIEGDFDGYCEAMRRPSAWGGEPEILMLTHVIRAPVEVFLTEGPALRSIGKYGAEEYGPEGGVAVLFHGAGHYEALSRCDE